MKSFLLRWLCTTIAVGVAVQLTGMKYDGWSSLIVAALLLGIINAVIRPVILLLSLPFIVVTLGFFILVVNALMLQLVGKLVGGFDPGGFWTSFFGALIISVVNWALSSVFQNSSGRFQVLTRHDQLRAAGEKRVEGKVIE